MQIKAAGHNRTCSTHLAVRPHLKIKWVISMKNSDDNDYTVVLVITATDESSQTSAENGAVTCRTQQSLLIAKNPR